jgi:uncharacterized protein with FMN-binding domain
MFSVTTRRETSGGMAGVLGPVIVGLAAVLSAVAPASADELVLTSGRRYKGLVLAQTDQYVEFKIVRATGKMVVRYPKRMVESLTIDGIEPVYDKPAPKPIQTRPAVPKPTTAHHPTPAPKPTPKPTPAPTASGKPPTRSRNEIEAMVLRVGRTQPDWWGSAKLDYPKTLDLGGRNKAEGWKPEINIGARIYSVITPNPRRWRGGIRLMHHVLTVRKDDPQMLHEAMGHLGHMYYRYEKDWLRAAFWWREVLERANQPWADQIVCLADCYRRLGNDAMAAATLRRYQLDRLGFAPAVKLWAELGETRLALKVADILVRTGRGGPSYGHLTAGNVHRLVGDYDKAIASFQKAVSTANPKNKLLIQRARENIDAIRLFERLDVSKIPNGSYAGTVGSFRGPLTVMVVVADGRIESVKVTKHTDDVFYTAPEDVPAQIVAKQSLKGIDAVTGATVTSEAIINAAAKALGSGMK